MAGLRRSASDIYLLPGKDGYLIKIRSIEHLIRFKKIQREEGRQLLNYCKFHSGMNISERRRPQLGAMTFRHHCFIRLSTVGDYLDRESLVIRLISNLSDVNLRFLIPEQAQELLALVRHRGLILLAGPTGSGKTSTIYYLAKQFSQHRMVMTIEDPVEIHEPSFLQLQVNRRAGMSYEKLLKVGLRHRPDVFIIGEIRDTETAQAAVQAALSGHIVLSTVHAKSPEGVIDRMNQLGIDEHYLEQSLNTVLYQRLLPDRHRQVGALLNVVPAVSLWPSLKSRKSLNRWRLYLHELVRRKQITPEVSSQYWYG